MGRETISRARGGIGIRAGPRSLWATARGSSTLPVRILSQIFGMDMSVWQLKAWRLGLATEKIEVIVDNLNGLTTIDVIAKGLIALPGTKRYQKMYEKGELDHYIMISIKRSKILKLVPYFNGSGSKEYIVVHSKGDSKDVKDGAI